MPMRSSTVRVIAAGMLAMFVMIPTSSAFNTVIDVTAGAEDNAFARGGLVDESRGVRAADWQLDTTVSGTDFANDKVTMGTRGIEYVMVNSTDGSTDTNEITYSVSPRSGYRLDRIGISQSPYSNEGSTWNGGVTEPAMFELNWAGGGGATIIDPDDQLYAFSSGAVIPSGATLRFTDYRIANDDDSWAIMLPSSAEEVSLRWRSSAPQTGSQLNREWITFDANIVAVPEPSTWGLLSLALLTCCFKGRLFRRQAC